MFIINYKDGSQFSENKGYWDDAPDKGITALHLTLPFTIKKRLPDGTVQVLDPSTVMISGFEAYYFANYAETIALVVSNGPVQSARPIGQGEFVKQIMAGIDYTHDFVHWVEVDKRGNVTFKRYTITKFFEEIKPAPQAIRKGA
jgi:hypothetical protein